MCGVCFRRDSLAAQLEITLTKADSEQLARSIAEEQYSDLEKEKIMKELELKEMMARHRQELSEKDITINLVCNRHRLSCGKTDVRGSLFEVSVFFLSFFSSCSWRKLTGP